MKKVYTKPVIVIEDFSLNANIAGDCEGEPVGNPTQGNCAVLGTGGVNIFSGTIGDCDFRPEDMGQAEDQWDGFCYHVPVEYATLFNS